MESLLLSIERTQHLPMISVCCICQRHRTPVDTWEPLDLSKDGEEFVITHGFCPDCIREHYPKASHKLEKVLA